MKHASKKSFINIIKIVIFSIFTLVAVLGIIFSISSKRNGKDGSVSFFGHQAMIVLTNSMDKCHETDVSKFDIKSIPAKSMIFIDNVPAEEDKAYSWYANIKVGDVLTFRYVFDRQVTVTHRVIEIDMVEEAETKGFVFRLMGDNKASDSNPGVQTINTTKESSNYVIGKVTGQSKFLGHVFTFLKSNIGIGVVIILPALTLLIYEVVKIIQILSENKKTKFSGVNSELSETNRAQNEEIERLKRELEEMKKSQIKNDDKSIDQEDK